MLIALFALAHLAIFRKPLPLQSSRCGKGTATTKQATTTTNTTTKAITNTNAHLTALTSNSNLQTTTATAGSEITTILIGTRLNMSSSTEQDQAATAGVIIAANGNQSDSKKIEVMYVLSCQCFNHNYSSFMTFVQL